MRLRLTLANTGPVTGKEVVQVYVRDCESSFDRPVRELKRFAKVRLAPGQSAPVEFELCARDLSFFSPVHGRWVLEAGDFEVSVGASSRDLRLSATVTVAAPTMARPLGAESTVGEWLAHPVGGAALIEAIGAGAGSSVARDPAILRMIESLPLTRLVAMSGGRWDIGPLLERVAAQSPEGRP